MLTEIFPHKEAYEMGAACQENPAGWQYPCGNKFTCLLCAAKDGQQRDSEEGPDIIDGLELFATAISQKVWSWSLERAVDPTPADAKEVLVKVLDVLEDYPRLRGLLSDRGRMRLKKKAIARLAGNVTWTASMPAEVLGRLAYDYGNFEVRLATISPYTTRAEAGYIVYRAVERPIQQSAYSYMNLCVRNQTHVGDRLEAIMGLGYLRTCKQLDAGLAHRITKDMHAALFPLKYVMNLVENAISYRVTY